MRSKVILLISSHRSTLRAPRAQLFLHLFLMLRLIIFVYFDLDCFTLYISFIYNQFLLYIYIYIYMMLTFYLSLLSLVCLSSSYIISFAILWQKEEDHFIIEKAFDTLKTNKTIESHLREDIWDHSWQKWRISLRKVEIFFRGRYSFWIAYFIWMVEFIFFVIYI